MKEEKKIDLGEWITPKSWRDITLKNLMDIEKDEKRDITTIISILTNHSVDEVYNLPLQFLEDITNEMQFIFEQPQYGKPTNKVVIDGVEYHINPQEKMRAGEYISVDSILKDDKSNYAAILAILCRKDGEVYDAHFENEVLQSRIELFENQSIMDVMPLIFFFINLWTALEFPTRLCSMAKEEISLIRKHIQNSRKNGGLSILSTKLLKRKLKKLEKSINSM